MTEEEWKRRYAEVKTGGYVEITENGTYSDIHFTKGEIWKVTDSEVGDCLHAERDGKKVTLFKPGYMSEECRWVGMTHPDPTTVKSSVGATPEEKLAYAQKTYPVGVQYEALTVSGTTKGPHISEYTPRFCGDDIDCGSGYIYLAQHDKWASLINPVPTNGNYYYATISDSQYVIRYDMARGDLHYAESYYIVTDPTPKIYFGGISFTIVRPATLVEISKIPEWKEAITLSEIPKWETKNIHIVDHKTILDTNSFINSSKKPEDNGRPINVVQVRRQSPKIRTGERLSESWAQSKKGKAKLAIYTDRNPGSLRSSPAKGRRP